MLSPRDIVSNLIVIKNALKRNLAVGVRKGYLVRTSHMAKAFFSHTRGLYPTMATGGMNAYTVLFICRECRP